ncbi:hypothetical protein [Arcobacter sp. CECT 8985]|uniref:hypothetical protein n=1 Tax=Arcobacter sp. CECT 8985 TaxID=1935424 RepID=UPI00100B3A81|nr:hypothetical protein [Arcobacter sp. CECT 8985]RXJ86356.1 hypothetical protein CRU93_08690 [Arcobacter sp. CECT 8985]
MKKVFILIFFISGVIFAKNSSFLTDEIEDFNNSMPFSIEKGSLKVDALGNVIDGKYKLKKSDVLFIGNNQYKINLTFERRKNRFLKFKQKRVVYVLINDSKFWIKYKNKVVKYKLFSDRYITKEKIHYKEKRSTLHVKINKLKLFLSFR